LHFKKERRKTSLDSYVFKMSKFKPKSIMKTRIPILIALALLALSTLNPQLSTVFAQGSLTPPGAPAPTMLTLSQIEPRTPISSVPYTISTPGSYYLTASMGVSSGTAITITASQVTLDLNGFTLSSTEASPTGTGILLAVGVTDITIRNGHIKGNVIYSGGNYTGSGFANGIYVSGSTPENVLVSHVSVSGCLDYGIFLNLNYATVVELCTVQTVGSYGIEANSISRSTAIQCGNVAIYANTADTCYGTSTGNYGLFALTANNCTGISSSIFGGLFGYMANNCYGYCSGASGDGLDATTANNCWGQCSGSGTAVNASQTATGCYGGSPTGTGLSATTALNCSGVSGSGFGLYAVQIATSSSGSSDSNTGLYAAQAATGCYGYSATGSGLNATTVNNCIGQSSGNGYGLYASQLATGSSGTSVSGTGLYAKYITIGCAGFSTSGTGLQTTSSTSSGGLPTLVSPNQYIEP
jgi:hypothetical protein